MNVSPSAEMIIDKTYLHLRQRYPKRRHGIGIDMRRQNTLENNSSPAPELRAPRVDEFPSMIPKENTVFEAVASHWRNDVCP